MKPVIVFVDDEPNILQGIKRYTRSQRGKWDLHFLESGKEAIELVAKMPVDVIVSDMRMPEISGADLLEHISRDAPGIIRFILSGEAEEAQTYRTVGRSHRFIAKPCDPASLISEIDEILSLRQELGYKHAAECLSIFDELQSPASVFDELQNELTKGDASINNIITLAESDPSLAARVLQLSNSAYFGKPLSSLSVARAIHTIGAPSLNKLLELERLGNAGSARSYESEALSDYQKAAKLAQHVSNKLKQSGHGEDMCDNAYATGLFAMLGAFGIKREENKNKVPIRAGYIARLFGMPETLTKTLLKLPSYSIKTPLEELANLIESAIAEQNKAAA